MVPEALGTVFAIPLAQALQAQGQRQRQRGWKLYSLHAPEVECIGEGKAHRPYEFGVKVSIAATNGRAPGGQFVVHAEALHGLDASLTQRQAYDGHTLAGVLARAERLTGVTPRRVYVDKGYRGHDAPRPLRVFLSGQKRGVFGAIKRELRRRAAIEAVIGHLKVDGHMGRNFLKAATATAPTPSSPRSATISASSSDG
jgi:IS5 family transposase